jgi:4-hydroxythreonine-4-phosphate dehydrogenase
MNPPTDTAVETSGSEGRKPIVGLSIGDPNGIGMEVILKTFSDSRMLHYCTPVIYAAPPVVNFNRKALRLRSFSYHPIERVEEAQEDKVNLLCVWQDEFKVQFGRPAPETARYGFYSLQRAVADLTEGLLDALVTAPIHKKAIQQAEFRFAGHTDYLAAQYRTSPLMMMVHERFRVALLSAHVPLHMVSDLVTEARLEEHIDLLEESLRYDFGINKPRIALLGLNPHAGEEGLLGREEQEVVVPLVERLRQSNRLIFGPYPADGYFATGMQHQFDATLAMYHDQGLIPFKTIAFDKGVNYTAGLPVVRTSPDHGTAFSLAGRNQADPTSFREAVFLAVDIWRHRRLENQLRADPLIQRAEHRKEGR